MKDFTKAAVLLIFQFLPMMCLPLPVPAQTDTQMRSILVLTGASSEEELDEEEIGRYLQFVARPLALNLDPEAKLLASGLLSRYQVASLEDYRSRSGDVLSFSELAAVDGFGEEAVSALRPFISLASRSAPGSLPGDGDKVSQDLLARGGWKGGKGYSGGVKYKVSFKEAVEGSLSATPSSWSGNLMFKGRRTPWRLLFGDYNLRFGQGLSLWSGLTLSGFSSSSSFSKRPSGLSPSFSWTGNGTHRGVAGDCHIGRFSFTAFLSAPGLKDRGKGAILLPGANACWYGRSGQVSLTAFGDGRSGKVSADFRWNRKGCDYFGETALDLGSGRMAAVAGTVLPLGGDWKLSGLLRSSPAASREAGAALGLERYGLQATADLAVKESDRSRRQLKLFLKVPVQVSPDLVLSVRMTERIRPYEEYLKYRTGARADLDWSTAGISARYGESEGDAWKGRVRAEALLCRSLAFLSYLEAGRKTGQSSMYLRGTLFVVDNWDDRIYSYERDAPGSFNVPAYYGRGVALSAVAGRKYVFGKGKKKALRLYLRASSVTYPFMEEPKPAKTEARLQASLSL